MCQPEQMDIEEELQIDYWLEFYEPQHAPWENGLGDSPGPTGGPSLSDQLSEMTVRLHRGVSHLSVASLSLTQDVPATFTVLKLGALAGYTVMLSCGLTSLQYGALIVALEGPATELGDGASVGLEFEPTTPNLVRPTIAPST